MIYNFSTFNFFLIFLSLLIICPIIINLEVIKQMSLTKKKNGLELLTHKNREQILYYISEAKIQIYAHCIIAYDPQNFLNLTHKSAYNFQLLQKQEQIEVVKSEKNQEKCQQQKIVSADKKSKINDQKMNQLYALPSTYHTSELNFQYSPKKSEKIIFFNNPDIAFYVDDEHRTIQIHNLNANKLQLFFTLESIEKLETVQEIFRKKLCELGFDKKYKKIKVLGKGATAEVYLVQRISDMKTFAAKIISMKDTQEKQFQIFVNEAKLLRILRHKNIIHLESVYIHKRQLIQVLEYLSGGTLLECLKKPNSMRTYQKWRALREISSGLDYLRKRRIVHRDLKLQNVMVRQVSLNTEYVISDFGLACWQGEKNLIYQKCGTPGYIAPEILTLPPQVNLLDHRCDIFSVGVISHLMFLLEPVFHYKGSVRELINDNKLAKIDFSKKKYKNLKTQQLNFLTMTLEKNIENRPTSEDLLKFLNNLVRPQEPKKSERSTSRRLSLQQNTNRIEVKIKRETSLTKKGIKMDLKNIEKEQYIKKPETEQISPRKSSFMQNAKKTVSSFWQSITNSNSSRAQQYKIKQNSVEKHKKMRDFFK